MKKESSFLLVCLFLFFIIRMETFLICMSFVSPSNIDQKEQESEEEKTFFDYIFKQVDYIINNSGGYGLVGTTDPQLILIFQHIRKDEKRLYNFRSAILKRYNFLWRFTHLLYSWDFKGKSVHSLSFSQSGSNLAVGLFNGMSIISAPYAQDSSVTSLYQKTKSIHCALFSPQNDHLLAEILSGTTIKLWDIRNNEMPQKTISTNGERVYSFAYSDCAESIILGTIDGKVHLINLATGTMKTAPASHDGWVLSVQSRSGDGCVISGGEDHRVMFWNPKNNDVLRFFAHNAAVSSTSCLPGSQYFISAGWDQYINIWNEYNCIKKIKAHDDWVMCMKPLLKGLFLVSGSSNGNLKLWSIPKGEELALLKRHQGSVLSLAVSPDEKLILSGCDSGFVKAWKTPMGFTPEELILLVLINHTTMCDVNEWDNYWRKVYEGLPPLVMRKVKREFLDEQLDGLPAFFKSKKRASWGKKAKGKKLRIQKKMRNQLRQSIKVVN